MPCDLTLGEMARAWRSARGAGRGGLDISPRADAPFSRMAPPIDVRHDFLEGPGWGGGGKLERCLGP